MKNVKKFVPKLVTVTWLDPRSSFDSFAIDDVLQGKGCGPQRHRQTVGYLCFVNEEYLEVYSDLDVDDHEVGGGTAIINVLVSKIKMHGAGVIFKRE